MGECNLKGCGILVTRAAHQSQGLVGMIRDCHGCAIELPGIEIWPAQNSDDAKELMQQSWDWVIFVSPNAVRFALKLLPISEWRYQGIGAVGATTGRLLREAGFRVDLIPSQGYDSEGLLSLPELSQLRDQQILIIRGEGGRALLGDTLEARGGKVRYAEVYQRVKPETPVDTLLDRWSEEIHLVTATSKEVLNNLVGMFGISGSELLTQTPLVVISERMVQEAERLGFREILRAKGADDRSLMTAICSWTEKNFK